MNKTFIDTNVFVYANDARDPRKQHIAIAAVKEQLVSGGGVVSTQVLMEYAAVAIGKLRQPRDGVDRQLIIMERYEVVGVAGPIIRNALALQTAFKISFWDAVILSAAESARCSELLSEDFADGRTYGSIVAKNPFS